MRRKLTSWKQKSLSFGGRVCLINSVLNALPLFYLSFFRIPMSAVKEAKKILRSFLWGGSEGVKKVAWVKWDQICKPKEAGGLGVKDWTHFNSALLGKWRWKLNSGCTDLCSKILWARYGNREKVGVLDCRSQDSLWWKDLYKTCFDSRERECWFDTHARLKLGCGNSTSFWRDRWCEGTPLKCRFKKLFHLSTQKNYLIKDMGEWVNGSKTWVFRWRRSLSMREETMVEELKRVITGRTLLEEVMDSQLWTADPEGVYSVSSAYSVIHGTMTFALDPVFKLIWSKVAPSNICSFAWKVVLDRLPTRVNLRRRRILSSSQEICCPVCQEEQESLDHLLLLCPFAVKVWTLSYRWLGLQTTLPGTCRNHLLQHEFLGLNSKQNEIFRVIWMAVLWSLWIHRNNLVFRGNKSHEGEVFETAIRRAWHWISSRVKGPQFSIYDWLSNPIVCIKMLG